MAHTLEFSTLPSMGAGYLAVLKPKSGGSKEVPRIEASVRDVVVDRKLAEQYDEVCGLPKLDHVAPTFLHVLAAPMHLQLLTHEAFPFKALGVVHVRNNIKAHAPVERGSVVNIDVFVEGAEEARSGLEFEVITCIHQGGELVWEETTTVLYRTGKSSGSKKERTPPEPGVEQGFLRSTPWRVPGDMGRRYAAVSGDYNPIHLFPLTAKAFGFKRQIVHGMWSQARVLGDIVDDIDLTAPIELDIAFKRPLTLPNKPILTTREDGDSIEYRLASANGKTLYLEGFARPLR